jgi:transposase-like protein
VYRAVDQDGQVIDVLVSVYRDAATARRFFKRAPTYEYDPHSAYPDRQHTAPEAFEGPHQDK